MQLYAKVVRIDMKYSSRLYRERFMEYLLTNSLSRISKQCYIIITCFSLLGIVSIATNVTQDKTPKYGDLEVDKLHHNYVFLSPFFRSTRTTATGHPGIEIGRNWFPAQTTSRSLDISYISSCYTRNYSLSCTGTTCSGASFNVRTTRHWYPLTP